VSVERAVQIRIDTDKPLYQPGQTMHTRLLALNPPGGLPPICPSPSALKIPSRPRRTYPISSRTVLASLPRIGRFQATPGSATTAFESPRSTARRIVAKVELHCGELFPRVSFIVTNLETDSRAVVRFYNRRGTAEQWIKEGKQAVKTTWLSCHRSRSNEVRLMLSLIAHTSGNLWRRLVLPAKIDNWSLTSLQQRLVKTGGRLVKHACYYWLLLADSHLTRRLFASMVRRIDDILPDKVLVYLWPTAGGTTFTFRFRPRMAMEAKNAPSALYDYYNPDARLVIQPVRFRVQSGGSAAPER
jgi:hypothetical protein